MDFGIIIKMNKIKKILSPFIRLKYHIFHSNGCLYIGKGTILRHQKNIFFGKNSSIAPYCLLVGGGQITIGQNCEIGYFSEILCHHSIAIGDNTICGPYLFITDLNHEYRNPDIPICEQGIPKEETGNKIIVGEESWIGSKVTIVGNVHIGKHVVIGANSFVNKDIPDYCVAVGTPAKIIKKYNFLSAKWEKVN